MPPKGAKKVKKAAEPAAPTVEEAAVNEQQEDESSGESSLEEVAAAADDEPVPTIEAAPNRGKFTTAGKKLKRKYGEANTGLVFNLSLIHI